MKRFLYLLLLVSFNLRAQIPQTLSYQGLLTTSTGPNAGLPIADGSYSVTFNFYTDPTAGTRIDFRTINVTTFQGLFATVIGSGVAPNQPLNLNPPLGSTQYYIGLQVNGEAELLPRVALTAVPYAFTANTAYSLASSATIAGSQLNGQITNSSVTIPFAQITGSLASTQIPTGSITNDKLATGIEASKIVGLPPATIADGSITDAKLIGISASKITGTLATTQYGTGSITNDKLATGIEASKIVGLPPATIPDESITNAKLASDISASKISAGTLSVARLADGSITNDKLATGIEASKIVGLPPATIADGSITDAKLIGISASKVTGTLATTQYGDGSITNDKLATGIEASKIVGLPPATIADGSITDAKLIGISASKVTGTLATTQYGASSITNEKLANDIDASKVTVGTLSVDRLADGSITNSKLVSDISASKITEGTLSVARLADGSITNEKLASSGIDASKITSGTLSVNQLADVSITDAKLIGISASKVTGTLTTAQYGAGSITNEKLASDIDASKLTAGTIPVDRLGVILPSGPVSSRPTSAAEGTLRYNSDDKKLEYFNGINWFYTTPKFAVVKDAPSSGSNGGGSTTGWQIRNLNLVEGGNSFLDLSNNQFTLSPGEYIIEASSPGVASNSLRVALVNPASLSEAYYGTSEFSSAPGGSQSTSFLVARLVLTTSKSYEVRLFTQSGVPANGLGLASTVPSVDGVSPSPNELYTMVKITKLR
jgi:hypothetical protein